MVPGRAGMMTHDYKRHGTTDLFAAMNLAQPPDQFNDDTLVCRTGDPCEKSSD
jgi:hypothetical protein